MNELLTYRDHEFRVLNEQNSVVSRIGRLPAAWRLRQSGIEPQTASRHVGPSDDVSDKKCAIAGALCYR